MLIEKEREKKKCDSGLISMQPSNGVFLSLAKRSNTHKTEPKITKHDGQRHEIHIFQHLHYVSVYLILLRAPFSISLHFNHKRK